VLKVPGLLDTMSTDPISFEMIRQLETSVAIRDPARLHAALAVLIPIAEYRAWCAEMDQIRVSLAQVQERLSAS